MYARCNRRPELQSRGDLNIRPSMTRIGTESHAASRIEYAAEPSIPPIKNALGTTPLDRFSVRSVDVWMRDHAIFAGNYMDAARANMRR